MGWSCPHSLGVACYFTVCDVGLAGLLAFIMSFLLPKIQISLFQRASVSDGGRDSLEISDRKRTDNRRTDSPRSSSIADLDPNRLSSSDARPSFTGSSQISDGQSSPVEPSDPLISQIDERAHATQPETRKLLHLRDSSRSKADDGNVRRSLSRSGRSPLPQFSNSSGDSSQNMKKLSILSKIINPRRKGPRDQISDRSSETSDRAEGHDAGVYVRQFGFTPSSPRPPRYIKIRSKNKKVKDFNRIFLAQELNAHDVDDQGTSKSTSRALRQTGFAIWALEISVDGRYVAAGGQDRVVRIWAVISTPEERQMHEAEEDALHAADGSTSARPRTGRLSTPIFKTQPIRKYEGQHTSDILALSWSKNNFLISSSMDKTVRLYHVTRQECLATFLHTDFVTSIAFHPQDDRFFLAGSLDCKLRLWSIPDKQVAYWNQLPEIVTAVAFTPDGKTAIAGCYNGQCMFYATEGLKFTTQIHIKSSHGKNSKGSKITGIQVRNDSASESSADAKMLITSNDSRVRLFNLRDKSLEVKYKGLENTSSQIHATFNDDGKYVICGSEDHRVYIWDTHHQDGSNKEGRPLENYGAHSAMVTAAMFVPEQTRRLLASSGDPIYDLCNPPPVRLDGAGNSVVSSRIQSSADDSARPFTSSTNTGPSSRPTDSDGLKTPDYMVKSGHRQGNIIITADARGLIKIFRQDCAFEKRRNLPETWDTSSMISKRILTRSAGTANGSHGRSRSNSAATLNCPSDRIHSWRNSIGHFSNSSHSLAGRRPTLEQAPNKSPVRKSNLWGTPLPSLELRQNLAVGGSLPPGPGSQRSSFRQPTSDESREEHSDDASLSSIEEFVDASEEPPPTSAHSDRLLISEAGQSAAFWRHRPNPNRQETDKSTHLGVPLDRRITEGSSALTSDESGNGIRPQASSDKPGTPLKCSNCRGTNFVARRSKGLRGMVCTRCGSLTAAGPATGG